MQIQFAILPLTCLQRFISKADPKTQVVPEL